MDRQYKVKRHLYVISDGSYVPNSRGYYITFTGIRLLPKLWKRGLNGVLIDEFRISKPYSKCHYPMTSCKQSAQHIDNHMQTYDIDGLNKKTIKNLRQKMATSFALRVYNHCNTV